MATLTPEQRDFVLEAPQVSMELDAAHREIVAQMTDSTLILEQQIQAQERDFAIATLAALEEEIQKRKNLNGG